MSFLEHLTTERAERAYPETPICVEPQTTVRVALGLMKERNVGAVMVCRDGVLVGIFTERDALRMIAANSPLDVPIEKSMSADPVSLSANDTVGMAIAKMSRGGYRRLPIVDEQGRPKGILKVAGILHYLVDHFPKVVYNLPPEPFHATHDREGA